MLRQERLKLLKLHLVRVTEGRAAPSSLSLPDSGHGSEGKRRSGRSRERFHLARPVGGRLRGDKLFLSVCCATRQRRANGGEKKMFFLEATRRSDRTSRVVFLPLLSESSGGQHTTFS